MKNLKEVNEYIERWEPLMKIMLESKNEEVQGFGKQLEEEVNKVKVLRAHFELLETRA